MSSPRAATFVATSTLLQLDRLVLETAERCGQLAHPVLGAPEDDDAAVLAQHPAEGGKLCLALDADQRVPQPRLAGLAGDPDAQRVDQMLADHRRDPVRHRRR